MFDDLGLRRRLVEASRVECDGVKLAQYISALLRGGYPGELNDALRAIAGLPSPPPHVRDAWAVAWNYSLLHTLPIATLRAALPVIMPPYEGPAPITIYRGQSAAAAAADKIGVCWSTAEAIARRYASTVRAGVRTVVLSASAPREAILTAVDISAEIVVDPDKLHDVTVISVH